VRLSPSSGDLHHKAPYRPTVGSLADSVRRISHLVKAGEIRPDLPGDGEWLRCDELLAAPSGFDTWRESLARWLQREYGTAPERTTAGYLASWYAHVPAQLGALLLHHERRVPSLRPGELAFRLAVDRPHPEGFALLGTPFHCLPTDPGSALPEATVVADEHALAAVLRARYTAHIARFVAAFGPHTRLGRRTLWAAATDALDSSLWWAGKQGGTAEAEGAGVADAALVLPARFAPLVSASTLRSVTGPDGKREWARRRESCCFSYLLPGTAECADCPRTCPR
jgi:hypothetical protein